MAVLLNAHGCVPGREAKGRSNVDVSRIFHYGDISTLQESFHGLTDDLQPIWVGVTNIESVCPLISGKFLVNIDIAIVLRHVDRVLIAKSS